MITFILAAGSSHLGLITALLAAGLLVGVIGHIISSRALIITGILVIGVVSVYFSFVLQPAGK